MADELAVLASALERYQLDESDNHAEAMLAVALTGVVEKQVRPSLQKKLRPQDVDDVCSEIILGFWKFRLSVRPGEVEKLVNTLAQRKHADQVRGYYRDAERIAHEPTAEERGLLELLPARSGDPGAGASQEAWELLQDLSLSAQDHLVAYTLFLGAEKLVIAEVLGINIDTVTNSLKRCRQALASRGLREDTKDKEADA
ncbi:hypothetical protein IIA79_07025 [bacterium]|nr:hypothetical protein [bacterium]